MTIRRVLERLAIVLGCIIAAFLYLAFPLGMMCHAQTIVTATNLKMGGYPITTGVVYFTPVNASGTPIAFADGTGAQNGPAPFAAQITNGVIVGALTTANTVSGTFTVPDSTQTTPANVPYNVMVCDRSSGLRTSGLCYTMPRVLVSGATWALDHYGPPAVTTTATIQVVTGTTVPSSCTPPTLWYNSTSGAIETCVAGVFVVPPGTGSSGSGSGSGTTFALSIDGHVIATGVNGLSINGTSLSTTATTITVNGVTL